MVATGHFAAAASLAARLAREPARASGAVMHIRIEKKVALPRQMAVLPEHAVDSHRPLLISAAMPVGAARPVRRRP